MSVHAPSCETLYVSHLKGYPLPNLHLLAKFLSSVTELTLKMINTTVTDSDSLIITSSSSSSPPPYEKFHISRPAMVRILVEHIHDNLLGSEALKQNCHSGNTREGDGGRGGTSSEIEGRVDFGVEDELNGRCLEEIYKSCKAVFQGILPSSAWKMFLPILLAQVTTVSKSAEERAMIYGLVTNIENERGLISITQRIPHQNRRFTASNPRPQLNTSLIQNMTSGDPRTAIWHLVVTPHSHVDVAGLLGLRCEEETFQTTYSTNNTSFLPCNSYSRRDFLGCTDPVGKWRDGILTSVLDDGNAREKEGIIWSQKTGYRYILVEYPVDEVLAESLSVAYDSGRLQMDGNFSYSLPDDISIIFIAQSVNGLAESLLNRLSVVHMNPSEKMPNYLPQIVTDIEEFTLAMKELLVMWANRCPFSEVSNILANKHFQLWNIFFSHFSCHDWKNESHDHVKLLNVLVYAFLWSFCQGEGDNGLEGLIKDAISRNQEIFGCVSYSTEVSLFAQDFDGSVWYPVNHSVSVARLVYRLVVKGNSVLFVGSSLSQLLMLMACEELKKLSGSEFEYNSVTDLRLIVQQLQKSKEIPQVYPCISENKRMVLVINNVDTYRLSDIFLLRDILEGFVFRATENFERMQISNLSVIAFTSGSFYSEALASKKPYFDKFVTIDIERDLKIGIPEYLMPEVKEEPLPQSSFHFIQILARGNLQVAKVALEIHRQIRMFRAEENDFSPIRLLKLYEREAFLSVFADADNADHSTTFMDIFMMRSFRCFYLPLYTQESRKYMKCLFLKLDIWNQEWELQEENLPNYEYLESLPLVQAEAIVEIDRCIRAIDTSNVISVVGDAGVGKRFIISIACKKRNLQLIKATPQDLTKILATCGNSAAIQISMSGWGSKWRRYFLEMIRIIKTRPKLTIFFILSTNAFDDRTLEAIFSVLRTSTEIIGLPRWSKGDLRSCKLSDVDTEIGDVKIVMEWLINIHMEILQLCQKENVIRPTISVFKICHRLCIRQISLSKAALDERIKILSQVFKQYHQFEDDLGLLKTREACAYDIHKIST